jgi:ParB family chromosome partitioning protein
MNNVRAISINEIHQHENSRLQYNEEDLLQLMVSMKQTGQLQPIGVSKKGDKKYVVIFGNRRFVAAKKLGWKFIDATIFETPDQTSDMIANATENMVRSDVSLPEQGRIFYQLTLDGLTLGEIAARVSIPKSKVEKCLEAFKTSSTRN